MSSMGPEMAAAVCGPDGLTPLFPWHVVPATVQELPEVHMIAYKPGAGQLPAWWSTPHRCLVHAISAVLFCCSSPVSF